MILSIIPADSEMCSISMHQCNVKHCVTECKQHAFLKVFLLKNVITKSNRIYLLKYTHKWAFVNWMVSTQQQHMLECQYAPSVYLSLSLYREPLFCSQYHSPAVSLLSREDQVFVQQN